MKFYLNRRLGLVSLAVLGSFLYASQANAMDDEETDMLGLPPLTTQELYVQAEKRDIEAQRTSLEKEAAARTPLANYNIGEQCFFGQGLPQSYSKARFHYECAAAKGNLVALDKLGVIYAQGNGVHKGENRALKYFQRAAYEGRVESFYNMALLYYKNKDYSKAMSYYQYAARFGMLEAQNNLGAMYFYGEGVPQDYKTAFSYFQQVVNRGNLFPCYGYACNQLSAMYKEGLGVGKNDQESLYYSQCAAKAGYNPH